MASSLEANPEDSFQKKLELYLRKIDPLFFYLYRYKTEVCPNKLKDHNWD
jgi:hypothetical protein